MTLPRESWARLVSLFRKRELDREFEEELAVHIELATEDHLRHGMTRAEARRLALIKLGGIEPSKELHRQSRGAEWLDEIVQDIRHAARSLRRSPGFAFLAVAMLATGTGVSGTVFAVTNALFKKPPFDPDDRILYLHTNVRYGPVSYSDFQDWSRARSFQDLAVVNGVRISLSDQYGLPESYDATQVSANAFRLLGQRPVLGR